MNSNSVSLVTAGYTNWTATVSEGMEIAHDLTSNTLKIGASYTGLSRYLSMKVYGLKIYESDVLEKDYLPFYRNGVAGLTNRLDATDILTSRTYIDGSTVSDGVLTNVVFEAGGAITDDEVDGESYFEFSGTKDSSNNYGINTGLYLTSNSCVEIDFSLWSTTRGSASNAGQDIFCYGNTTECLYARFGINTRTLYYWFHDYTLDTATNKQKAQGSGVNTTGTANHERYQFKLDGYNKRATLTCNGVTVHNKALVNHSRKLVSTSRHLWIGASQTGGTRPAFMKLYSCKVSEAGVPMRHFVPCTHDGVAGLYDLLNGVFYPHDSGKVYGKGYTGQNGDFEVALPQSAKIRSIERRFQVYREESAMISPSYSICFAISSSSRVRTIIPLKPSAAESAIIRRIFSLS